MTEAQKDTARALAASKAILDGRDAVKDRHDVLVTLDHTIATILIAAMGGDPQKAARMLNEGTVPGVEERIALFASKVAP